MGQTGRRSIATHILAVKIGSAAAHFHGFGVARQGPWVTSVNRGFSLSSIVDEQMTPKKRGRLRKASS